MPPAMNRREVFEPKGEQIASYTSYAEAQRSVDYLSDKEFDVKAVMIVGTDLKLVERITGRLNYPRAALSGAASGAWFGLFVGLVLALLAGGDLLNTVLFALLIGAGFGMLFGVTVYAMSRGRRDFTSASQVVASTFSVLCLEETAGEARRLLSSLEGANVTTSVGSPSAQGGQGAVGSDSQSTQGTQGTQGAQGPGATGNPLDGQQPHNPEIDAYRRPDQD